VGLDRYVTSGCDRLVVWVTELGRVVNDMWSSTGDRVVGCQYGT
jgi:hypothetical protein